VARGEAVVVRHQDDERFPVHDVALQVVAGLRAQEGQVQPAEASFITGNILNVDGGHTLN